MCLIIDADKTADFKRRHKTNKKIKIYKIFNIDGNNLQNIYSGARRTIYKPGPNEAQGRLSSNSSLEAGVIHAHKDIDLALDRKNGLIAWKLSVPNCVLLTCWAWSDDFVAIGTDGDIGFTKIYIPEDEYKKALANAS